MARQEMYHIQHRFSKVNNGSRIVDRLMVEQTNISRQNGEMSHHNLGNNNKKKVSWYQKVYQSSRIKSQQNLRAMIV